MRTANLVLTLALALPGGPLPADAPRTLPADVGPGRVAWFDLTTTDLARAKAFYGRLLDWQFAPVAGTDLAPEIRSGGTAVGTLRVAEGRLSPYNGVVYIQVADPRASCQLAKQLGGTVVPGFPFDLPDCTGAIALVAEPAGHPLGLYSRTPLPPASAPK
jgi:predicted enzyme related to lactoylglutathione lyase